MNKLEEISRKRRESHAKLLAMKSRVYQTYLDLEAATLRRRRPALCST